MVNEKTPARNKWETLFVLGMLVAWIIFIIYVITTDVNAYYVKPGRVIYTPPNVLYFNGIAITSTTLPKNAIKEVPKNIILNEIMLDRILNLKPKGESWAYQRGYFGALDDMQFILGLRAEGAFASGPSVSNYFETNKICYPEKNGFFEKNYTRYDNKSMIEFYWFNNTRYYPINFTGYMKVYEK